MIHAARRKKLLFLSYLLFAAAALVAVSGGLVLWRQQAAAPSVPDVQAAVRQDEAAAPPSTEEPGPSVFDSYQVAADLPRYIFIPKIDVKAMVEHVGLTPARAIGSPANVFNAAWYTGSAKPGAPGAAVVDGHVSSWEVQGVFYDLKKLERGDTVTIELGDGNTIAYRVVESHTYEADKVDMQKVLAPINPAKPGLNLISCTGSVIKGTNDFSHRVVVFAEQV